MHSSLGEPKTTSPSACAAICSEASSVIDEFVSLDSNKDGVVTRVEWIARYGSDQGFDEHDLDGDGTVDQEEFTKYEMGGEYQLAELESWIEHLIGHTGHSREGCSSVVTSEYVHECAAALHQEGFSNAATLALATFSDFVAAGIKRGHARQLAVAAQQVAVVGQGCSLRPRVNLSVHPMHRVNGTTEIEFIPTGTPSRWVCPVQMMGYGRVLDPRD